MTILKSHYLFTVEFTSDQLHTQRACPATNHRDDADVLGHNGRVKKVGLCAVVIRVSGENLQRMDMRQKESKFRNEM